jgi:CheY-like chemotaxis protein
MELSQIIDSLKRLEKFSILYAEDEATIRTSMLYILERFSNDIVAVSNGMEAWDIYQKHRFSIVITDLQMPQMNGASLIDNILRVSPEQIIIVISAFHDTDEFHISQSDTLFSLTKPLILPQFLDVLREVVVHEEKRG